MKSQFGDIANAYDLEFTESLIGKAQREAVWRMLNVKLKQKSLHILETNCGTGEDALFLLKKGHHVTLSDSAQPMLQIAEQKLHVNKQKNFSILQWDLRQPFPVNGKTYDLIFSNFGGWNCLDALELLKLSATCNTILNPGGQIIAIIMGRKCFWERWYFKRKGNIVASKRRLSEEPVMAALGNNVFVETWYYSPDEIQALFPDFKLKMKQPIGLFIPPSYLNPFFMNKKWLIKVLVILERIFGFSRFSNYADHYMITLQKR